MSSSSPAAANSLRQNSWSGLLSPCGTGFSFSPFPPELFQDATLP
jgi:hypothetical protein